MIHEYRPVPQKKEEEEKKENNTIGMLFMLMLVIVFVIAFFIMLVLFLMYRTEDTEQVGNIFIYDENGADWDDDEELAIFYNEEFGTEMVAPYSAGTYVFMFQNLSEFTLDYTIDLSELNEYDIALCYRIKRDGAYLVDEYTRVSDFSCTGITIEGSSTQYFELEWYWDGDVDDVKDTLAGINDSIYTLTITLTASAAE